MGNSDSSHDVEMSSLSAETDDRPHIRVNTWRFALTERVNFSSARRYFPTNVEKPLPPLFERSAPFQPTNYHRSQSRHHERIAEIRLRSIDENAPAVAGVD